MFFAMSYHAELFYSALNPLLYLCKNIPVFIFRKKTQLSGKVSTENS